MGSRLQQVGMTTSVRLDSESAGVHARPLRSQIETRGGVCMILRKGKVEIGNSGRISPTLAGGGADVV